ncbi:MAG: SRPBCC domain-containing protein [Solirubrobacterales bacterium]|nr:SRPBCC domain-containing protein [Solirubrobacterales bacterium]
MSAEPLVVEFEVGVDPARAFDAWTRRCATWWPASHTISGDPAAITFEPRPGGRIVERGRDGATHDWGRVLDWEPPHRLRYAWHLFFDPREATEIEVTFAARESGTAVRLEQRGWERLGAAGPPRRAKTGEVWGRLAAAYADAVADGDDAGTP